MTGYGNSQTGNNGQQGQGNPAWNTLREHVPDEAWDNVQPILSDWDRGVQQRFEKYSPYNQYIENKVDPETIDYGLGLMERLNSDEGALEVYNALAEHLRVQGLLDSGQEPEPVVSAATDENPYAAQLAAMEQKWEMLAEAFVQKQKSEEQLRLEEEQDMFLEAELARAHDQYGDFDDREILMRLVSSDGEMSIDDAVQDYFSFVENIRQRPAAPRIMGSSGNFPTSEPVDPTKWSRDQVAQNSADLIRHYLSQQ